jgi:hypothetical protein
MRNLQRAAKKLEKIAAEVGNRKVYYRTLCMILNREFKSLKVRFAFRKEVSFKHSKCVTVEAFYCGELDLDHLYEVNVIRDPKMDYIKPRRKGLFREIYLVLAHEFRHAYQYRRRNFRVIKRENPYFWHFNKHVRKDVRYLIEYDELDAYAFETAEEMKLRGWGIKDLRLTSVYRTMYGKKIKKYAPKHFQKWVRKVSTNLNRITSTAGNS